MSTDNTQSSILDHPLLSARYFYPRRAPLRDVVFVDCGDACLACQYHVTRPGARTLVHFHGNGEVVGECVEELARPLAEVGVNVFFAEYRGYGLSTGSPSLGTMLNDVEHVIRATGLPEEDLILFGRSVGSIFAIHGTLHFPGVAGLVIESGIADPLERILLRVEPADLGVTMEELQAEVSDRLNHGRILERFKRPALFLHAANDELLPVDNAERMHAWAGGPKSLVIFERGNHNTILAVNFESYMSRLRQFVASLVPHDPV